MCTGSWVRRWKEREDGKMVRTFQVDKRLTTNIRKACNMCEITRGVHVRLRAWCVCVCVCVCVGVSCMCVRWCELRVSR